jgi:hypothetical protein
MVDRLTVWIYMGMGSSIYTTPLIATIKDVAVSLKESVCLKSETPQQLKPNPASREQPSPPQSGPPPPPSS